MKRIIYYLALAMLVLTSCDKEELSITEPTASTKKDILSFATQEDFDKTLAKVNAMTKTERLAWEKQQGFKSFGTMCDEFYETINPANFKSTEDIKAFVAKNSDKIEFYTSSDGENYCEPRDYNGLYRNIIGEYEMFIIGDKVFKIIGDKLITTSLENIDKLKKCNKKSSFENNPSFEIQSTLENEKSIISKVSNAIENSAYKEGTIKIGSDNYKLKLYLRTTSYRDLTDPSSQYPNLFKYPAYRNTEYRVINYARWMMIWWVKSYHSYLSGTITTNDDYNVTQSLSIIPFSGPTDDSEYRSICVNMNTFIDSNNNSTSYFVNYNITAKNTEKNLIVQLTK